MRNVLADDSKPEPGTARYLRRDSMESLQKWFTALVGVNAAEQERLARAHAIFNAPQPDLSHFEIPACWRRSGAH